MNYPGIKALFTKKMFKNDIKAIARNINVPEGSLYFPLQKHTDRIHVLEEDLKPVIADAVLTQRQGILIGVQVADCVPLLISDKVKRTVGAVHAGWRGTARGIMQEAIKILKDRFHVSEKDIVVAIGPSIRKCCYEVGADVMKDVQRVTGKAGGYCSERNGKYVIDLSAANKIQALAMGVLEKNIWQSRNCTFCNPALYHSYRYTGNSQKGQYGLIGMF
jgi:YfiH family protein